MNTALSTFALLAMLATPAIADDEEPAPAPDAPAEEPPIGEAPVEAPAPVADSPVRGPFANAPVTELVAIAPAPARSYRGALSLQLATLDSTGLAIQAERASKTRKKVSVAIAIGARSAAQGEYESRTLGAGVEVRRWLRRPQAMTGWYVGARTDLSRTKIEDQMEDREIGKLTTWTTGISTGYRWVFFRRVELTPSAGLAMVVEGGMDGRSPTTVRGAGILGLTAGWILLNCSAATRCPIRAQRTPRDIARLRCVGPCTTWGPAIAIRRRVNDETANLRCRYDTNGEEHTDEDAPLVPPYPAAARHRASRSEMAYAATEMLAHPRLIPRERIRFARASSPLEPVALWAGAPMFLTPRPRPQLPAPIRHRSPPPPLPFATRPITQVEDDFDDERFTEDPETQPFR